MKEGWEGKIFHSAFVPFSFLRNVQIAIKNWPLKPRQWVTAEALKIKLTNYIESHELYFPIFLSLHVGEITKLKKLCFFFPWHAQRVHLSLLAAINKRTNVSCAGKEMTPLPWLNLSTWFPQSNIALKVRDLRAEMLFPSIPSRLTMPLRRVKGNRKGDNNSCCYIGHDKPKHQTKALFMPETLFATFCNPNPGQTHLNFVNTKYDLWSLQVRSGKFQNSFQCKELPNAFTA